MPLLIAATHHRTGVDSAKLRAGWLLLAAITLAGCGGGGGGGAASPPPPVPTYSVGGTVTGLNGTVVLADNGGDSLSVTANSKFTFPTTIASGGAYAVTIATQPAGQTCTVGAGSGTVSAAVVSVTITCVTNAYTLGGTVSGLTQAGLSLSNNGGAPLSLASGSTAFAFPGVIPYGTAFVVTIVSQPVGQTCSVSAGASTVKSADSGIAVNCVTNTYSLGGSISGLTSGTLVLSDGTGTVSVRAGATSFSFPTALPYASNYAVVTQSPPASGACLIGNGVGVLTSAVTAVSVSCSYDLWTWASGSNSPGASGVYVSPGIASSLGVPAARSYASTWTDRAGNLWLFGGINIATGAYYNDFWMFSPVTSQWTWVGGSALPGALGTYGPQGVATAGAIPGARGSAAAWTDSAGNFWLFGGSGYPRDTGPTNLNDLWEYSPGTGLWTWVGGLSTDVIAGNGPTGSYGTRGVAAPANWPGARVSPTTWTDRAGNLWLFGGQGWGTSATVGYLNDLWEYSPSSGWWTWISGSNTIGATGVYGLKGTATAGNTPGARVGAAAWSVGGTLWLYGGNGIDQNDAGCYFPDLWTFSPVTGLWTWVSGSNVPNDPGSFGTQGIAAAGNAPAARTSPAVWADASGVLWMFGGQRLYDQTYSNFPNDLWRYDPKAGAWTWITGSNLSGAAGVYGAVGVTALGNVPGGRVGVVSWVDANGKYWMFGGVYYAASTTSFLSLNDMWSFTPATR